MATGGGKTGPAGSAPRKRRGRMIKACEGCRALKTRCQFSERSLVCDKCIELNRPCTMLPSALAAAAPSRKRRAASARAGGGDSETGARAGGENARRESGDSGSELEADDAAVPPPRGHAPRASVASVASSTDASLDAPPLERASSEQASSSSNASETMEAINGDDAMFDSRYPSFDMRAVLDPDTYVPGVSPLPADELDVPNLLDPDMPDLFFGMDVGRITPSESPEQEQSVPPDAAIAGNPKNRILFNLSPMAAALRHVDPAMMSGFGIASRLMRPRSHAPPPPRNVISLGVISREHAIELMDIFKLHLNHWILMPTHDDTVTLLDYLLQKCPLLVTVCCAAGLRLCSREAWSRYYPALVEYMAKELSMTLARAPQNVEFLQAIMLLSIYGGSLSFQEHVFDMWYLSGIGVQQCMTNLALQDSLAHHNLRLWNHLVHVHIHSSAMTGRAPLIDDQCIELCRRIMKEPLADRFDSCVLTEIIMYDSALQLFRTRISYDEFLKRVDDWHAEWSMVLSMTAVQFADTVRLLLEFSVRATHLRRLSQAGASPASAATLVDYPMPFAASHDALGQSDLLTAEWFNTLPSSELLSGLTQLNKTISGVVTPASGRLFRYLSDMLHDVAFTAAVLSVTLRKILARRTDVPTRDAESVMSGALALPRRLAELFHATSRGADLQQSRCFAIVRLLQGAN